MAYTPELDTFHSAALRRIAWALKKPMTKTLAAIVDNLMYIVDPGKICETCKDKSCETCMFGDATPTAEAATTINSLKFNLKREVSIMKPNQVSVLISKKIGKNFCSWSVSQGVTAELEDGDHYKEAIIELDAELKDLVAMSLPMGPKGSTTKNLPAELPAISPPEEDSAYIP